jgi:AGZA family xanthine/uracil permease-like MFS transporter
MSPTKSLLNRWFDLAGRGTTLQRELRGAFATFLTMSYILFVNPSILQAAGVPFDSAVACTALAAGVCCLLMGTLANFPIALASGMGLNAVVAYQVAQRAGSWQVAMGLVFWDGVIVLLLVLCGLREAVMRAIPRDLRRAIGAGIGLFIAFIGAVNARIVIVPAGTLFELQKNPRALLPPVTFGSLAELDTLVAITGLILTAFLLARKVRGALIIGIAASTLLALALGQPQLPFELRLPSFTNAFQANVLGALQLKLMPFLFAILMVDFFDTLGTVTAISDQGELTDKEGHIPNLRRVLLIDAVSASIGGLLGASSVTCYIESAAGVAEGARTGLHSIFVGLLFLVAIFLAPVAGIVPPAATAPALMVVGFLMVLQIARIDFAQLETALPAFITLVLLPFTYSIAHGIGYGFIAYTLIKVLSGKFREVHLLMYGTSAAFAAYFILGEDARPLVELYEWITKQTGGA